MRTLFRKACAAMGSLAILLGAGIVTENPLVIVAWLAGSVSLLLMGRAFTFQQKQ